MNILATFFCISLSVAVPPPDIVTDLPDWVKTLKTPGRYPEFAVETVISELDILWDSYQIFVKTAANQRTMKHINSFLNKHFEQVENNEASVYTIYQVDPIASLKDENTMYVKLRNVFSYEFRNREDSSFHMSVMKEVGNEKELTPSGKRKIRKDFLWDITVRVSFPSITLYSGFNLLQSEDENLPTDGKLKIDIKKFKLAFVLTVKTIDKGNFRKPGFNFRVPDLKLEYDLEDLQVNIESMPQTNPRSLNEEDMKGYLDSVREEILTNKEVTASRICLTLIPKLTLRVIPMDGKESIPKVLERVLYNGPREESSSDGPEQMVLQYLRSLNIDI